MMPPHTCIGDSFLFMISRQDLCEHYYLSCKFYPDGADVKLISGSLIAANYSDEAISTVDVSVLMAASKLRNDFKCRLSAEKSCLQRKLEGVMTAAGMDIDKNDFSQTFALAVRHT